MTTETELRTELREAYRIVNEYECANYGHKFDVQTCLGQPTYVVCRRCVEFWTVSPMHATGGPGSGPGDAADRQPLKGPN